MTALPTTVLSLTPRHNNTEIRTLKGGGQEKMTSLTSNQSSAQIIKFTKQGMLKVEISQCWSLLLGLFTLNQAVNVRDKFLKEVQLGAAPVNTAHRKAKQHLLLTTKFQ